MKQTAGYAILRMPMELAAEFDISMRSHKCAELFQQLCVVLESVPRTGYRGISNYPLKMLPSTDPEILRSFENSGADVHTDYAARLRFLQILGDHAAEGDFDEDLIPDYRTAREISSLLDSDAKYELLHLAREPYSRAGNCLGFDIGYWGGDHFSLSCDSAVRPMWHPPSPECFKELAHELRNVNEHCLFRSAEEAARFREFYRSQNWAEIECRPDEFCIIQISEPHSKV